MVGIDAVGVNMVARAARAAAAAAFSFAVCPNRSRFCDATFFCALDKPAQRSLCISLSFWRPSGLFLNWQ